MMLKRGNPVTSASTGPELQPDHRLDVFVLLDRVCHTLTTPGGIKVPLKEW